MEERRCRHLQIHTIDLLDEERTIADVHLGGEAAHRLARRCIRSALFVAALPILGPSPASGHTVGRHGGAQGQLHSGRDRDPAQDVRQVVVCHLAVVDCDHLVAALLAKADAAAGHADQSDGGAIAVGGNGVANGNEPLDVVSIKSSDSTQRLGDDADFGLDLRIDVEVHPSAASTSFAPMRARRHHALARRLQDLRRRGLHEVLPVVSDLDLDLLVGQRPRHERHAAVLQSGHGVTAGHHPFGAHGQRFGHGHFSSVRIVPDSDHG